MNKYIHNFFLLLFQVIKSVLNRQMGGVFFVFILLSSCASLKKKGSVGGEEIHPQDIPLFESAFQDLGAGHYRSAIPHFKKLADKYKGQSLEWPALYNLGSAYKELGHCDKAKAIYEQLMAKTNKLSQKNLNRKTKSQVIKTPYPLGLKPRLYLSLSYVYECLGEREQSLKMLKQGKSHISHLAKEVRLIEYPARLFLALIEVGEKKQGLKIQHQLYQNLEILKKDFRISQSADESFARYFYTIGRSHVTPDQVYLPRFLKVFPYHQAYLVQAVLLKAGKWSVRAEKELGDLYRKMWVGLEKHKKPLQTDEVQKILTQLKQMVQGSSDPKISRIYRGLRSKTLAYLN